MSAEFFLDTNVLVYTFDHRHADKRNRARELVQEALKTGTGIVSYQVAQEFLNVATRKFETPLTGDAAQRYLRTVLEPLCAIFPTIALYERALGICERWRFGFYDCLIVSAALEADCELLYSEDLQNGQKIETLTIVDPFAQ